MESIKTLGGVLLGLLALCLLAALAMLLLTGAAWFSEKVLPTLYDACWIALAICVVVLLPLTLFRVGRIISAFGFMISSFVFGATVWLLGLDVTYTLWGVLALFVGLVFAGVGVVPIGMLAAAFRGEWEVAGELFFFDRSDIWFASSGRSFGR
jgi:hypothetical protein